VSQIKSAEPITPILPRASPITCRKTPRILRSACEWPSLLSSFGWLWLWSTCHESWRLVFLILWEWWAVPEWLAEPLVLAWPSRGDPSVGPWSSSSTASDSDPVPDSISSNLLAAIMSFLKLAGWSGILSALANLDLDALVCRRWRLFMLPLADLLGDIGDVELAAVVLSSSLLENDWELFRWRWDPPLDRRFACLDFGQPAIVLSGSTSATLPLSSATAAVCASALASAVWLWPSSAVASLSVSPWLCPCPPPWLWPCSWKRKSPRTLERRPKQPTIKTKRGFDTSCGSTNRCIASRNIDRQSATKKTPLTKAPSVSARCH